MAATGTKGANFEEKLNNLRLQHRLGNSQHDTLSVLINAGSAAAHRGWDPSNEQITSLMEVLEAFLYHTLVQSPAITELSSSVPPRDARDKNAPWSRKWHK